MPKTAPLLWSRTAGARFVGRILATRLRDECSRCVVSARHARLRRLATMAVIKLNLFILLLSLFGPQAQPGSTGR